MSHEIAKVEKLDLTTLTAEQGALLDKLKLYSKAEDQSRLARKMFAYLKGRTANALFEITEKGVFEKLMEGIFPDTKRRWLYYCRDFAAAVDIGKHAPLKFLPDNRLLKAGDLQEDEKEKVQHAIEKVTGDKGVMTVIKDYKKKLAREKAKDAPPPTPADEAKRRMETACLSVAQLRQQMAILAQTKVLALIPDELLESLEEDRITFGHEIAKVRKHRKGKKK
jgi:hypothetical protein